MKNKGLLIIFIILFLLSSASAGIGYYEHTKSKPEKPNTGNTTEAKITYKYYLEDEESTRHYVKYISYEYKHEIESVS